MAKKAVLNRSVLHGALLVAVMLLGCADAMADTLVLRDEVYVKGPKVLLGELAEIEGGNADILAGIEVTVAALPGNTKHLNASLVESRIRSAGFSAHDMVVKGARRVRATTTYTKLSPEMLAESLRLFIETEMPWDPSTTEIDVPQPLNDVVTPEGDLVLEWRANPQYRYLGAGSFRGTITVDGRLQRTLLCKAVVEAYGEVVVAAKEIPRGRIISSNDIETRTECLSKLRGTALREPGEALGLVSRRSIFPGQLLSSHNLALPKLVKRNQMISVELRSGGLVLKSKARALVDGCAGDVIRCANLDSGQEFQGVVRPDGVVLVP